MHIDFNVYAIENDLAGNSGYVFQSMRREALSGGPRGTGRCAARYCQVGREVLSGGPRRTEITIVLN